MKKVVSLFLVLFIGVFLLSGCTSKEENGNLSGSLSDIMADIYKGIEEDKLPMALGNTEITKDNLEYYTGLSDLDFVEGIASESKVGSIAHSVVLLRVKDSVDINKTKEEIKEKVNPRKWICVGVDDEENVIVDNISSVIVLIMDNDIAQDLEANFKSLNK